MQHFSVKLSPVECPTGYANASIRGCMCCGNILCGMGGSGLYLCKDCFDKMQSGDITDALNLLQRKRESGAL